MPRHSLDKWTYKLKTMDVCITKHKESDIYNHMVKMYNQATELFTKYETKYKSILKEFDSDSDHMYSNYNWRQGDPSRYWKKHADQWYLADVGEDDMELVLNEYFLLFNIYHDFVICDKYAEEWNDVKPEWNSMIYEVTEYRNILKDVADTIKLYEEMDYNKYKALWMARDKDWIEEQKLKKEHSKNHSKIELPNPTNLDVEPEPYPTAPLRDDCIYCRQHWEEMKPKYEKAVQVWKKNKQEDLEWRQQQEFESQKLKEERQRKSKQFLEWLSKQEPEVFYCEHCDYNAKDDDDLEEHCKKEEHKKKARYCKICDIQCRNDADYAHHIETTKHKKNAGLIEKVKVYKCSKCDYQTTIKANFHKHIVCKNHQDD